MASTKSDGRWGSDRTEHRAKLRQREDWIIDPIFPTEALHLIGGESGSGKSTWLLQLLHDWSQGKAVLGGTSKPCKWVYISIDRSTLDTDKTLRRLGIADWDIPCYSYHEVTSADECSIFSVAKTFERDDIKLFVIEGLQALLPSPTNKADLNKVTLQWSQSLSRHIFDKGKTIIATIHAPKGGGPDGRQGFLGSASLPGICGTMIKFQPDPHQDYVNVTINGRNIAPIKLVYERGDRGQLIDVSRDAAARETLEQQTTNHFMVLDSYLIGLDPTVVVPTQHFVAIGKSRGVGRTTVYKWIEERVQTGLLAKEKHGWYRRWVMEEPQTPQKSS